MAHYDPPKEKPKVIEKDDPIRLEGHHHHDRKADNKHPHHHHHNEPDHTPLEERSTRRVIYF